MTVMNLENKSQNSFKVPAMPLVFLTKEGKISRYNLRRFGELPYHLVRCKQYEDLYVNVLFNYQWLYAKMSACPLQASSGLPNVRHDFILTLGIFFVCPLAI